MKWFLSLILIGSLAANAYLATRLANPAATPSSTSPASSSKKSNASTDAPPAIPPDVWALVIAGDARSAEQLLALGLPEKIVRALIRAEVNARYLDRERALIAGNSNYWERNYTSYRYRSKDASASLDLTREKNAELKRLLGDDFEDPPWWEPARHTFLPREKREQLKVLQDDYQAMRARSDEYYMIRLPEDAEKQRYLIKQERADIEALLTPEELAQHDLRQSNTASQLRWRLTGFAISEEEYKTLYALRKPFDEKYNSVNQSDPPSPELLRAKEDDQKALDAAIKDTFGEQRYAEFSRAKDEDYKYLSQLTARLEIPPEKIIAAYELKKDLEKKLKDFKPVAGSDAKKQRADYQAALTQEAETGFKKLLGEKATAAVSEQSFRRLRPPLSR